MNLPQPFPEGEGRKRKIIFIINFLKLNKMARQSSIIKLKGTIGGVTFYKSKDGYLAREKGGVDASRIKNDPAFQRTRENGSEFFDTHKTYKHTFPDSRADVDANMYHIDALPMFIRYINEVWIPQNATQYFKQRDPVALDYLPKLLS